MKTPFNKKLDMSLVNDYLDKVDLSTIPGEKELEETFKKRLLKSYMTLKTLPQGEPVCKEDIVTISLESTLPKFNKSKIQVTVGTGLFNKEIEASLIGKRCGESYVVTAQDTQVKVAVLEIKRKEVPPISDAMVVELGIEGIDTIEKYKEKINKELMDYTFGPLVAKLMEELLKVVEIEDIDESDLVKLGELEKEFFKKHFKEEKGLNIDEMSTEEFKEILGCESMEKFIEMRHEWYVSKLTQCFIMLDIFGILPEGEYDPTLYYDVYSKLFEKMMDYVKEQVMRRKLQNGNV